MVKFDRLPSDILQKLNNAKEILENDNNVIFAYLFGGLSRGRVNPLSDVDIAVYARSIEDLAAYKIELFLKLSKSLNTSEIDLIILNIAPISVAGRIIGQRQVLVDNEPFKRHKYESITLRKFFDFKVKESAILKRRYCHAE